jgi:hypothetical protein
MVLFGEIASINLVGVIQVEQLAFLVLQRRDCGGRRGTLGSLSPTVLGQLEEVDSRLKFHVVCEHLRAKDCGAVQTVRRPARLLVTVAQVTGRALATV